MFAGSEVRYTKYNIHSQSKDGRNHKASYANYTNPGAGHVVIPAGSEITITKKKRKAFYFSFGDGKNVVFEFHQPRMGMSVDEYIDLITSTEPTSLKGLSKLDKKGVAEGKAIKGMTRKGSWLLLVILRRTGLLRQIRIPGCTGLTAMGLLPLNLAPATQLST